MGLDDYPKIHPRHEPVEYARLVMARTLADLRQAHDLTPSEVFAILGEMITREAKTCIVSERSER